MFHRRSLPQIRHLRRKSHRRLLHQSGESTPTSTAASRVFGIATDLELENLRISSKAIDIDGYGVDVGGSGSISVSASNDLQYQCVAAIATKQGFLTNTLARLEGAKLVDGKPSFPLRIDGTIENANSLKGREFSTTVFSRHIQWSVTSLNGVALADEMKRRNLDFTNLAAVEQTVVDLTSVGKLYLKSGSDLGGV